MIIIDFYTPLIDIYQFFLTVHEPKIDVVFIFKFIFVYVQCDIYTYTYDTYDKSTIVFKHYF